jgi:hypothetical protein
MRNAKAHDMRSSEIESQRVLERVAFNQKQKASKGAFERKREAVPFEFN